MHTLTRSAFASLALLGLACARSPETAEPATPPPQAAMQPGYEEEPLTPAAGMGETPAEAAPAEPVTPPEPERKPLVLQHGQTAYEIADVLLMKDPKGKKHKLMFFRADVSCEDVWEAKNKTPESTVMSTEVSHEGDRLQMVQPMKWTFYRDGKPTPIKAKAEEITLTTEMAQGKMVGTLKMSTTLDKMDLRGEGPFEVTVCEPPQK